MLVLAAPLGWTRTCWAPLQDVVARLAGVGCLSLELVRARAESPL